MQAQADAAQLTPMTESPSEKPKDWRNLSPRNHAAPVALNVRHPAQQFTFLYQRIVLRDGISARDQAYPFAEVFFSDDAMNDVAPDEDNIAADHVAEGGVRDGQNVAGPERGKHAAAAHT